MVKKNIVSLTGNCQDFCKVFTSQSGLKFTHILKIYMYIVLMFIIRMASLMLNVNVEKSLSFIIFYFVYQLQANL